MTTAAEFKIRQRIRTRARVRQRGYEADPWHSEARPEQTIPPGDWVTWLIQSGRGWGKTRAGSETTNTAATYSKELFGVPPSEMRIGLVARTAADSRDTMVEGVSGVMNTARPWNKPEYEPSKRRITWANGAQATTFTAEEPDLLRGPEHHFVWADEAGAWEVSRAERAWDNIMFGLRAGDHPRIMVTTTPRRTPLMRRIVGLSNLHVTRGRTQDNADNLADVFLDEVLGRYEGTRIGRQEIEGELLEDREGALWTLDLISTNRVQQVPDLDRVVVGVDPAGGGPDSTGIVVAGRANEHYYVLADDSVQGSPQEWGTRAVRASRQHRADRIVAETNYGGAMVQATIRAVDPTVSFKAVTASRGKAVRAEPIAALYEQGRVHHVGTFRELEDEMTDWAPGDTDSPDRMDALVWALTDLSSVGKWEFT